MKALSSQRLLHLTCLISLLTGVFLHPLAGAHRDHGIWTEILWTNNHFEITHQIHLADALTLLDALDASASLESLKGQALIALHLEETFSLKSEGAEGSTKTIGAEIDDDFLFIYQEWYGQKPLVKPRFSLTALNLIYGATRATIHYQIDERNELIHVSQASPETHEAASGNRSAR